MNMHINSETLEKVEYLRTKADISYEEAVSMLERFDGDLTRVLIELERSNRLRGPAAMFFNHQWNGERGGRAGREEYHGEAGYDKDDPNWKHNHRHHKHAGRKAARILFHNNLEVTRDGDTVMNLPVVCYIVFFICAPYMLIPTVAAMLLFGCHIGMKKVPRSFTQQDVSDFASRAAGNVQSTINNVTETIRKGFDNNDHHNDGGSGEGGEFTVE